MLNKLGQRKAWLHLYLIDRHDKTPSASWFYYPQSLGQIVALLSLVHNQEELCRGHGFSEASYYTWRNKFGGMDVSDAKRLKALETENSRLKRLLAESLLENEGTL